MNMGRNRIGIESHFWQTTLTIAVLIAGSLATSRASAQIVAGNDQTGPSLWLLDVTGANPPRDLFTGSQASCWAMAADEVNQMLYWTDGSTFYKAAYDPVNPIVPILVGTISGSNTVPTGLAFDTLENKLYSRGSNGFNEIDVNTGVATLVFAQTSQDFGGFDYDPVTDAFYGTNDSTSTTTLPGGRGIYRINKPLSAPTFTELADYPGGDTDIDGLTVGNGKLYLVNDNSTADQGIYVFDLTSMTFETPIPNPFSATSGIFSGGAWAPGMLIPNIGTNLQITMTDTPDPVVPPGGNITYSIMVTNNGPDPATGVTVSNTLPGNVTFVSVDPPGVHNAGVITANIGNLAATASASFNLVVQSPATPDTVMNTASVTGNETDPFLPNNSVTATTTVRNIQADLVVDITDPADCAIGVGGTVTYTVTVSNPGPEGANNVVVVSTLPNDATFQSSNPPGVPVGNMLTSNLGSIGPGGSAAVTIDVSPTAATVLTISANATADEDDPDVGNNSDSEMTQIIGGGPTEAPITAVFSTIVGHPSANVPDLPWQFATTAGVERPYRSPDGTKWIILSDTNNPTATADQVILVGTVGGSFSVVAQEAFTQLPEGDIIGIPGDQLGINDAGQWVFSTNTDGATTSDEVVVKWDGTQFVTVAREGNLVPAFPPEDNITFGTSSHSTSIQNDGTVSFFSNIAGATTATDSVHFTDDGATILAREGVTVPTSQGNGTTFPYDLFATGTNAVGLSLNASGTSFSAMIDLVTAPTTEDRTNVVDNDVKIQEGFVVPSSGFTSVVSSGDPNMNFMESNGDWFAKGTNVDGQDWVVRNGVVVAATGDELIPASGLFWGDASLADTFISAAGNNNGDYVIGGVFNGPPLANQALVINGTTIVARENDPIDLDNNGVFDDGYFIRSFEANKMFMTNTVIYCVVGIRDANAALCGGTDTDLGDALVSIPIGPAVPACCKGDVDGSANVDSGDIVNFVSIMLGNAAGPCPMNAADVNNDTAVDGLDVAPFVGLVLDNAGAGTACP